MWIPNGMKIKLFLILKELETSVLNDVEQAKRRGLFIKYLFKSYDKSVFNWCLVIIFDSFLNRRSV
jgi:hypothetical protein